MFSELAGIKLQRVPYNRCRRATTDVYSIPRRESASQCRLVLVDFTHMNTARRVRVYDAGNMCTVRRSEGLSGEKTAGRYLL